MSFFDIISVLIGIIIGYGSVKRYVKDYIPDNFFYEPKHQKKSTVRKWLERVAFFVLGGD